MDDELQIYDDLIQIDIPKYEEKINDLEVHINKLNTDIQTLCSKMLEMRETQKTLVTNISALYKTARCEIDRKDRLIVQLRKEKDDILFRKGNFSYNKRPHSPPRQMEVKRGKFNNQREQICNNSSRDETKISSRTSGDKEVVNKIEQDKEIKSMQRVNPRNNEQPTQKNSREKEHEKKFKGDSKEKKIDSTNTRKEKEETNTKSSKDRDSSRPVDTGTNLNNKSKDNRKIPNRNNHEPKSFSNKETERSKSKETTKSTHLNDNRRSPKTNRTNIGNTSTSTSHYKRDSGISSSKSSNNQHIPRDTKFSNDLRNRFTLHSKADSSDRHKTNFVKKEFNTFDKDIMKNKDRTLDGVQKKYKNITGSEFVICSNDKLRKKDESLEEGELMDESLPEFKSNLSDDDASENIVKEAEDAIQTEIDRCKSSNIMLNEPIQPTVTQNNVAKVNLDTKSKDAIEPSANSNIIDLKPANFIHDYIMKDVEMYSDNNAETKIDEDDIVVELHIHPKSDDLESNNMQAEMLLAQLEENTLVDTLGSFKTADSATEYGSGTESQRDLHNNENVNTSNSIDTVQVENTVTVTGAPINTSISAIGRRRRRAVVFMT